MKINERELERAVVVAAGLSADQSRTIWQKLQLRSQEEEAARELPGAGKPAGAAAGIVLYIIPVIGPSMLA